MGDVSVRLLPGDGDTVPYCVPEPLMEPGATLSDTDADGEFEVERVPEREMQGEGVPLTLANIEDEREDLGDGEALRLPDSEIESFAELLAERVAQPLADSEKQPVSDGVAKLLADSETQPEKVPVGVELAVPETEKLPLTDSFPEAQALLLG